MAVIDNSKPSATPITARQVVLPGMVGNVLEWYDFALYGYLAPVIAQLFFPSDNALAGLIQTYAVFAIGFLARPVGAVVFGHLGDRLGRKSMLAWSITMMALPTCLLGLLPTYESVGVLAPVLLLVLRLLQGASTGGEFSGSCTFMVEHAPPSQRARFGSLAQSSAMAGGLLGAAAGWLVTYALPTDQLHEWGWRLPFLCGILVGAFGLWIRIGMHDTPVFKQLKRGEVMDRWPLLAAFRSQKKAMLLCIGLNWASSVGYFLVFAWFVGFLNDVIGLPLYVANGIGATALLVGIVCTVGAGYLADRIGLYRVVVIGLVASAVCAIPLMMVASIGTIWAAVAAQFGLVVFLSLLFGTLPTINVTLFSPKLRCTAFSASYNVSVAVAGGSAPLIATALIQQTGWSIAPGIYVSLAMLVGLIALAFVPRTRS